MDAIEAIKKRRSVRSYTGEAIPKEDLMKIVDAGHLAATGNNFQPWEFIVITNKEMISELKVAAEWMENAGAIIAIVIDPSTRWWAEDGAAAAQNMLVAATALGYGTCWLEGYTLQHEQIFKGLLNVPEDRKLMTLIPVGVPTEWPTKEKRSLDDVIRWETY
jgi:nitroreductase